MKHLMKTLLFKMSLCLCLSTIETVLLTQLMLTAAKTTFPTRIPIGIFLNETATQAQLAVRYEIEKHNNVSSHSSFKLDKFEKFLDITNNALVVTLACATLKRGVFALVGSVDDATSDVIASYSKALQMPYVTTGLVNGDGGFTFSMNVPYDRAIVDVIRYYNWNYVYYIYDSEFVLRRLQETLRTLTMGDEHIHVTMLRLYSHRDTHRLLRTVDTHQSGDKVIVLDLATKFAYETLFRQAVDQLDLSGFHFGGVNITGFRLMSNTNERLRTFRQDWLKFNPVIDLETALAVDALSVVTRGLRNVLDRDADVVKSTFRRGKFYNNNTEGIQCRTSPLVPWTHGAIIASAFREVDFEGLSGRVQFNNMGSRTNFSLEVLEARREQALKKVGLWKSEGGLQMDMGLIEVVESLKGKIMVSNSTKVITTIEVAPFLMRRNKSEDGRPLLGNERFEGYCADLAKRIAERLNFDYILKVVDDGKYGSRNPDGTWDGMIGELTTGKAHMAIAPLTITAERERVADFTKPFMELGISIMIKRPEKQKPSVFSFMEPLSTWIWLCILFAYSGLGLTMFLVSNFSPYEWQIDDSAGGPSFSNDFTLRNCLWFALAALMQQGCDICPRGIALVRCMKLAKVSLAIHYLAQLAAVGCIARVANMLYYGRTTASVWWFFTLILVSSYTANLAAFLTIERTVTPIKSAEELESQRHIDYGTLKSGSTKTFFEKSPIAVYTRMWVHMSNRPHVFEESVESGVQRVRDSKGKYAFLMESTMNDYHNQRKPCNTMRVGANLDSKGYGVATPIGSDLKTKVNLAILTLLESGELARMQKKWWYEKGECNVESEKGSQSAVALTLSNVAGIFYILIGGLGMAMIISLLEFLYNSRTEDRMRKKAFDFGQRHLNSHQWGANDDDVKQMMIPSALPNHTMVVHRTNGRFQNSTEV